MAKLLKLTGIKTFIAPFTGAVIVKKGESIRVEDAVAETLMESHRNNAEGEPVYYWSEHEGEPTYNFTNDAPPQSQAPKAENSMSPVARAKRAAPQRTARKTAD